MTAKVNNVSESVVLKKEIYIAMRETTTGTRVRMVEPWISR